METNLSINNQPLAYIRLLNENVSLTFSMYILPCCWIVTFGGLIGIIGNFMIILSIYRSIDLRRNKCNYFVCTLACMDFVSSVYFSVYGVMGVLAGIQPEYKYLYYLHNRFCLKLNIPHIFSCNAGSFIVMAIGFDRVLTTQWPVFYKNLNRLRYLSAVNSMAVAFGLSTVAMSYVYADPDSVVPACVLPMSLNGPAQTYWNGANLSISLIVIILYSTAYCKVKRMTNCKFRNASNKRLLHSLIIVALIYITTWFTAMFIVLIMKWIFSNDYCIVFHTVVYVGLLVNVNIASNFFVYYCRSEDYRKEFNKIFFRCKNDVIIDEKNDVNTLADSSCVKLYSAVHKTDL